MATTTCYFCNEAPRRGREFGSVETIAGGVDLALRPVKAPSGPGDDDVAPVAEPGDARKEDAGVEGVGIDGRGDGSECYGA
jgi:hypothetical protein